MINKNNIIRFSIYLISFLTLTVIQTNPGISFTLNGAVPNLMIPSVIAVSTWEGERVGAIFGLVCGFAWDVLGSRIVGFNACILMFLGYFLGYYMRTFLRPTIITAFIINAAALLGYGIMHYAFFYLLWYNAPPVKTIFTVILPEFIYSMVFVLPMFLLVKKAAKKY